MLKCGHMHKRQNGGYTCTCPTGFKGQNCDLGLCEKPFCFYFSIPTENFSSPFFSTNKKNCHVSAMWINVKIMACALTTIMVVQRVRVSTVIRAQIVRQVRYKANLFLIS